MALESHERALAPVVNAFRKVDPEQKGVLSATQFEAFCRLINPAVSEKEIEVLLGTMDPSQTRQVSFSSCAATLSAELTRIMEQLPATATA